MSLSLCNHIYVNGYIKCVFIVFLARRTVGWLSLFFEYVSISFIGIVFNNSLVNIVFSKCLSASGWTPQSLSSPCTTPLILSLALDVYQSHTR